MKNILFFMNVFCVFQIVQIHKAPNMENNDCGIREGL